MTDDEGYFCPNIGQDAITFLRRKPRMLTQFRLLNIGQSGHINEFHGNVIQQNGQYLNILGAENETLTSLHLEPGYCLADVHAIISPLRLRELEHDGPISVHSEPHQDTLRDFAATFRPGHELPRRHPAIPRSFTIHKVDQICPVHEFHGISIVQKSDYLHVVGVTNEIAASLRLGPGYFLSDADAIVTPIRQQEVKGVHLAKNRPA